jgi:PhoH-like ATPase
MKQRIFVLDTCVILYDHNAYKNFHEHDVVIPIAVLEELDHFKKGNEAINFEAREFTRVIDKLANQQPLNEWVPIGVEGCGNITISFNQHDAKIDAEQIFQEEKPDHRILNVALYYQEQYPDKEVMLITKDCNLRVKAKALGLASEDYLTGTVKNINSLYTGKYTITGVDESIIEELYKDNKVHVDKLRNEKGFPTDGNINNAYFIIKNGSKSGIGYYNPKDAHIHRIEKEDVMNIKARNAEQIFAVHALMNSDAKIVTISGTAGTGKTLLAMAGAIAQKKNFLQIYIARPIVPLNNKDIGFLPGDISSKVAPYMEPLYDALKFIKVQNQNNLKETKKLDDLIEKEKLIVAPLAYIRGRSLHNILFIVDEAQNLSPIEIKTIITRMGENSKIVLVGDIYQIDSPYLDVHSNGLSYTIDRLKGEAIYSHVTLEKGERSEVATLAANKL